ncbi:MAG: hypothetical protein ACI8WB_004520 [Phenylobacterium sp.]
MGSIENIKDGNLLAPGLTNRALALYDREVRGNCTATINVSMTIEAAFYDKLKTLSADEAFDLGCKNYLDAAINTDDEIAAFDYLVANFKGASDALGFVKTIGAKSSIRGASQLYNNNNHQRQELFVDKRIKSAKDDYGKVLLSTRTVYECARDLQGMVSEFNEIGRIAGVLKQNKLSSVSNNKDITALESACDSLNEKVDTLISVRGPISGLFQESVTWRTLAFLRLISSLIGGDQPLMVATLSLKKTNGEKTFVLV